MKIRNIEDTFKRFRDYCLILSQRIKSWWHRSESLDTTDPPVDLDSDVKHTSASKDLDSMNISEQGLTLIKYYEGFQANAYLCPGGHLTIGYGHVVNRNENSAKSIIKKEAEAILKEDVKVSERAVRRLIDVSLTQGQFDALVSFTFNLGQGSFQSSTLRTKVNQNKHDEVPKEFMRWVYSGKKKLVGLVKRRETEAELYQSGLYLITRKLRK